MENFRRIPANHTLQNTKFAVTPKRVILHPNILPGKISSANKQRRLTSKRPFYHDLIIYEVPDLYDELEKKERFRFIILKSTNSHVLKSLQSKKTIKTFAIQKHAFQYFDLVSFPFNTQRNISVFYLT